MTKIEFHINYGQEQHRCCTCEKRFLPGIVTDDEKWIHHDDPSKSKAWGLHDHHASASAAKYSWKNIVYYDTCFLAVTHMQTNLLVLI